MESTLKRTRESLTSAFDALAGQSRRQQQRYAATIAVLIAVVVFSGLLLAGLAAGRHIDYRRGHVAQYMAALSQLLQNEASFVRRSVLTIRYQRETPAVDPARDAAFESFRRTGAASIHADGVGKDYHLLATPDTRLAWGARLPKQFAGLRGIALATMATQQAFGLDHDAFAVALDEDSAVVIRQPENGARAPMALDPTLIPLLRTRLIEALRDRTGHAVPARDQPVWIGPLRHPVDDSPVMMLVSAAYAGDRPTTLVAACIPVQGFLATLHRPSQPALLLLVNEADEIIDVSPREGVASAAQIYNLAARARHIDHDTLLYTSNGVLLVEPLQAGVGLLVYFLPYRMLAAALAAEFAGIAAAMLVLVSGIVLTARYWSRHLLRRTHADASRALESELMTHILVSATPVGLCIVRQRDYGVLMCNQRADTLLQLHGSGQMPDALVQAFGAQPRRCGDGPAAIASLTIAAPAAARESDAATDAAQVDDGTAPAADATAITNAADAADATDAAGRFLQITYAPARYRDDDVLFCAVLDCTAQQALEDQLRSAQQATEAMMRARSTFFAAMSHEIRTPLNALLGNLELLARSPGLETHAPRLQALDAAAGALRRIVNDVLDFSKIDAGKLELVDEPFRPIDAFESLALTYAPMTAGRPLRFHLLLSPSLDVEITGDRTRLVQVINNLLNNAFKFTASGRISFSAEVCTEGQGIPQLVCRVGDSGIGMPPLLAARVFRPFVQGDAAGAGRLGGTGLGLSICARLCELMGGSITVASVPDIGSAFTVRLPVRTVPAARQATGHVDTTAPHGHVLVLCQDARIGENLEAWLNAASWRTSGLASLAAAREYLAYKPARVIVASGDFPLATMTALREAGTATVVWVTPDGPHRPHQRAPGILEVTAYSHHALLACVATAARNASHDSTGEQGPGNGPDNTDSRTESTTGTTGTTGTAPAAPQPVPITPRASILVAEDNPLNQALITEQLQTLGHQPIVVSNGKQALAVLETARVDAVLTDIQMPGMDGHELLEAVRARHPGVPVLAFSAFPRSEWSMDWRQRGFAGYVAKPASLQDLEACLDHLPARQDGAAQGHASIETGNDRQRYEAMLRRQLLQDLPELERSIAQCDVAALGRWIHAAAGAFMIVRRKGIVRECRALEALCGAAPGWTPAVAAAAAALRERLRSYMEDIGAAA
ncbi:ATP-binding protein [Cupriavidus sp. AcVe19-1a]|uniref:ATP-binding protein n=1 Tax=Cupriavidus sp. AcVe19-1a TaxID=2821359 RepID=UPI001AE8DC40|nr:ATP-binding protein [Cupriavidus sp. AcVe19-1a]MBP0630576.1 response regulator [Cupriavidus sp. AcVe19-1a]